MPWACPGNRHPTWPNSNLSPLAKAGSQRLDLLGNNCQPKRLALSAAVCAWLCTKCLLPGTPTSLWQLSVWGPLASCLPSLATTCCQGPSHHLPWGHLPPSGSTCHPKPRLGHCWVTLLLPWDKRVPKSGPDREKLLASAKQCHNVPRVGAEVVFYFPQALTLWHETPKTGYHPEGQEELWSWASSYPDPPRARLPGGDREALEPRPRNKKCVASQTWLQMFILFSLKTPLKWKQMHFLKV